jgi:DNA-binding response OmpR family regulator
MASASHILVVDDHREIRELVSRALAKDGFRVSTAGDGKAMRKALADSHIDLVLLDLMLPGEDGLALCRSLRAESNIPVIMLTAKGDETDRVVGLELGADDYLAKPFGPRELLARLRAVLRRAQADLVDRRLCVSGVVIDLQARTVERDGRAIELTGLEFDILVALTRRAGRVVPRSALLELSGRGDVIVSDRTVDVHVSHLRKKLEDDPPRLIRTVRGVGYVFSRDDS